MYFCTSKFRVDRKPLDPTGSGSVLTSLSYIFPFILFVCLLKCIPVLFYEFFKPLKWVSEQWHHIGGLSTVTSQKGWTSFNMFGVQTEAGSMENSDVTKGLDKFQRVQTEAGSMPMASRSMAPTSLHSWCGFQLTNNAAKQIYTYWRQLGGKINYYVGDDKQLGNMSEKRDFLGLWTIGNRMLFMTP